jgi:hypothetical protein
MRAGPQQSKQHGRRPSIRTALRTVSDKSRTPTTFCVICQACYDKVWVASGELWMKWNVMHMFGFERFPKGSSYPWPGLMLVRFQKALLWSVGVWLKAIGDVPVPCSKLERHLSRLHSGIRVRDFLSFFSSCLISLLVQGTTPA